jgi:iron(III) transport system ATP-binding protein
MMISVSRLAKRYGEGVLVLKDVSIEVGDGEFFTLLGPSGCGKTTLLRCIAGLETAEGGAITIAGRKVLDWEAGIFVAPERRNVGMVFQSYAIWPHMTVLENVAFPARVRGLPDPRAAALAALRTVELHELQDRPATRLSGGQQQRVALARAMVGKPDVLLLDEPLSNLDAALREQMRGELRRLQKEIGLTTILVTHDQAEALSMSDRIAVMDAGRIEEVGTPEDLYLRPARAFTAGFLGDSIRIPAAPTTDSAGVAMAKTPLGLFPLPRHATQGAELALYLRPDRVRIHATRPVGRSVEATVKARRFLGSGYEYDVDAGGPPSVPIRLKTADNARYEPGALMYLEIGGEAAILL